MDNNIFEKEEENVLFEDDIMYKMEGSGNNTFDKEGILIIDNADYEA